MIERGRGPKQCKYANQNFLLGLTSKGGMQWISLGRRFAAALLPRLFGRNPRSHHNDNAKTETNSILEIKIDISQQTIKIRSFRSMKAHPSIEGYLNTFHGNGNNI